MEYDFFQDPNEKVKEFLESKPLLSDFDSQIKYYQVTLTTYDVIKITMETTYWLLRNYHYK
jgi:hypothetical protein